MGRKQGGEGESKGEKQGRLVGRGKPGTKWGDGKRRGGKGWEGKAILWMVRIWYGGDGWLAQLEER